jgi:methyltransferase (TIGR00027 family)
MALGERGRYPLVPRSTAENMCALRAAGALERDSALRCPDDMAADFLGGFNVTTLAKHRGARRLFLYGVNRRVPGLYAYETMRVKFMDDVLRKSITAGLDELIVLGAGLDSRPYRLAGELRGIRVIEVDHPVSQASKRAHIRRILGHEPEHVTFVEIDFMRDDLDSVLTAAGHKHTARTLFIWSGVSPYLPEPAVANVLSWVGAHGHPGTSIAFDACWQGVIDGSHEYRGTAEWLRAVAKMGEPVRWGIPEGRVPETLSHFALRPSSIVTAADGGPAYFGSSDHAMFTQPMDCFVLIHAHAEDAQAL